MRPFVLDGKVWRVVRVPLGHPLLIDGTGMPRIATADMGSAVISIALHIAPPMLDRVLVHEISHALGAGEHEAQRAELAAALASKSLGRPIMCPVQDMPVRCTITPT